MLDDATAPAAVNVDPEDVQFESAVEMFFREPPPGGVLGWVSPLCLCRQELQDCFVGQVVGKKHIFDHPHHRMFATAMVALSGIELLARMVPAPDTLRRKRRSSCRTDNEVLGPCQNADGRPGC